MVSLTPSHFVKFDEKGEIRTYENFNIVICGPTFGHFVV